MNRLVTRVLLAASAAICALGAIAHAGAYRTAAVPALASAHLPPFFIAELKVLWLGDSTTLGGLALVFAYIAARPRAANGVVTILVAVLPAATAALLYRFLGGFYAAHLLAAAAALAVAAGVLNLRDYTGIGHSLR
jgi:hypothetical protein